MTGGEPHNVRRFRPRCRFLLAFTRFSRPRYLLRRATSAGCPDEVAVAIDVHGSEDQVKDASSAERERDGFPRFSRPVHALRRVHADVVPFLSCLWTSVVAGASPRGEEPVPDAGPNQDLRSDADPRRSTPSRRPGCLPPLRPRRAFIRRIAPPNESRASVPRSRRPHLFPKLGRVPSRALQAPECGHPRSLAFEKQAPFLPMGSILSNLSCLGLTTQARPSARPSWLVCES